MGNPPGGEVINVTTVLSETTASDRVGISLRDREREKEKER